MKKLKKSLIFAALAVVAISAAVFLILRTEKVSDPTESITFSIDGEAYGYDLKHTPTKITVNGMNRVVLATDFDLDAYSFYCIGENSGAYYAMKVENGKIISSEKLPSKPKTIKKFGRRLLIGFSDRVLYLSADDGSLKTLTDEAGARKFIIYGDRVILWNKKSYRICDRHNGTMTVGSEKVLENSFVPLTFDGDNMTVLDTDDGKIYLFDADECETVRSIANMRKAKPITAYGNCVIFGYKSSYFDKVTYWIYDLESSTAKSVKLDTTVYEAVGEMPA